MTRVSAAARLYGLLVEAVVWLGLVPVEVAIGSRRSLVERLGHGRIPPGTGPRLLLHAVSVGEMAAAAPLAAVLASHGYRIVATTMTDAGKAVASRLPALDAVSFLPWDRPRAVRRFLGDVAPKAVLVVETEIWPGLFTVARELGIPLFLVSARIYPEDVPRYRLGRRLLRGVLSHAWIGAQSEAERTAFLSIGAPPERTSVTGNLKRDVAEPASPPPSVGDGPFLVAGSTHPGEETLLLAALPALRRTTPALRLILAPRHPERCAALRDEASRAGLTISLLSDGSEARTDVILVDRIGTLPPLYPLASVAFLGGSLVPKGGQNPLEAAVCGVPIVIGPHVGNVEELLDGLPHVRLSGADALVPEVQRLLADPDERARLGAGARAAVEARRGATRATADLILGKIGVT